MSTDLVPQQSGGYLALTDDDYLSRLGGVVDGLKGGGNFAYLKMDGNSGQYSYGADDIELQNGTQLAMDWKSFRQGWIIWSGGQVADEVMVDPVSENVPKKSELPDHGPYGKDDGPREQQTIKFKLLEDPFTELLFQANNASKRNALGALMKDFIKSFKMHPGEYPVIEIDSNSFDAKDPDNPKRKFKKYAPKFKIVDWISADELNAMSEGSPEDYEQGDEEITDATEGTALPAPVEAEVEEVVEPTPAPQPSKPTPAAAPRAATRPAASRPAAAAQAPTPAAAAPAAKAPAAAPAGRRSRF